MSEPELNHLYELLDRAPAHLVAIKEAGKGICFEEVKKKVDSYTAGLSLLCQLRKGQRIAFYEPKSLVQVCLMFAAWRLGAVVIPISPNLKAAQVQHILNNSSASLLVTSASRAEALSLQEALPASLQKLVLTDKPWLNERLSTELVSSWKSQAFEPGEPPEKSELAALLYTSGSTGRPKGVMLSHQNLLLGAQSVSQYLGLNASDCTLALLPFSFDYGLNQLLSSWYVGASVALHNYFLPGGLAADLQRYKVTILAGVPPLWRQILSKLTDEHVGELRLVTNSGGALTPELQLGLRKLKPELKIFSMYGLTEAFRSSYLPPELLDKKPRSVGRAVPYARLMILDEDLAPCLPGIPGELVHAGPLVAQGYWNQPEQTAERFIVLPESLAAYQGERAVCSGDLAYMDNEGDLYILGRRDDQIKTSGYRVSPQEVEELALGIEGVAQAACFGVPDAELGQAIALVIHGEALSRAAFRSQYQMLAANYLWPKYILHHELLPLNPNGKIDRPVLRKRVLNEINLTA